jgi:DNA-binding FrmR family transcriptional regulator
MLFTKKTKAVGKHFILDQNDKKAVESSINKIIGQLETVKKDVLTDNACDETLTQILAIKGGVESVGRNLVGKGILDCIGSYSRQELEIIIKNLFKIS